VAEPPTPWGRMSETKPAVHPMTRSETVVFNLCRRSALSLWSYANPRKRDRVKELCDVLIVFNNRIVIFQVKEHALSETADPAVAAQRWLRAAVDEAIAQLHGARRELARMDRVIRADSTDGIDLPPVNERRIHLVAVATGAKRSIPLFGGNRNGDGYVHVIEEEALNAILGELDTAGDFFHYLEAKEAFPGTIVCEGEENLLAAYLTAGRQLPTNCDHLVVGDDMWPGIRSRPEFIARKEEDRVSYWWDEMIERFIKDYEVCADLGPSPSDHEMVVRVLAGENRFARRILSADCLEWLHRKQAGARNMISPCSEVAYVFGVYPRDWTREYRTSDLSARCYVARSLWKRETVVGIGTELYDPSGFSMEAVYMHLPEWTAEDERIAEEAKARFGFFKNATVLRGSASEFPTTVPAPQTRAQRNREKRERRKRR
jgi:hypothetical protein